MAAKFDERELGTITHFEHVNFRVPDHRLAILFFIDGLGLTRDPYRMVGVRNMWVNVGQQQFHLPLGEAIPFAGEIGLTVPMLADAKRSLKRVAPLLKETEFACTEEKGQLRVVSPWGQVLRLHEAGELSGRLPQAIAYVTFFVPTGTADGICAFYRDLVGAPAVCRTRGRLRATTVNVGVNQHFHFVEKRDHGIGEHPNHVAVYLTRYRETYLEFKRRKIVMEPDRNEQFRFSSITDLASGEPLFEFEHEMRSLYHPDYRKPLVNRVEVPYLVD